MAGQRQRKRPFVHLPFSLFFMRLYIWVKQLSFLLLYFNAIRTNDSKVIQYVSNQLKNNFIKPFPHRPLITASPFLETTS